MPAISLASGARPHARLPRRSPSVRPRRDNRNGRFGNAKWDARPSAYNTRSGPSQRPAGPDATLGKKQAKRLCRCAPSRTHGHSRTHGRACPSRAGVLARRRACTRRCEGRGVHALVGEGADLRERWQHDAKHVTGCSAARIKPYGWWSMDTVVVRRGATRWRRGGPWDREVGVLNGIISTLNGIISTLNGIISTLNGIISTLNGIISTLNGIISTLNGIISTLNGIISTLNGIISTLNGIIQYP
jgi:hypothetical protein